jgi:hypothetical protein
VDLLHRLPRRQHTFAGAPGMDFSLEQPSFDRRSLSLVPLLPY